MEDDIAIAEVAFHRGMGRSERRDVFDGVGANGDGVVRRRAVVRAGILEDP